MNYFPNNDLYLRTVEFLKNQIQTKGYNWDVSRMKPMDSELYVNSKIEVGGTVSLLDGATTEIKGITNFNGNKLVKDRVFVANAIAFGCVEASKDKEPHEVQYDYTKVPSFLNHASIVLKQNDEAVIKIPIASIVNGHEGFSNYRKLGALALIEDDVLIDYSIEFPRGVKNPIKEGNSLFISVYLKGIETYLKR